MMPQRQLRRDLPPIPPRMQVLPIEDRGYPVPWFVEWIDGKPDFRVMDRRKWGLAIRFGYCWLCGEPCGVLRTFVIGPMCGINRTTSEPACHLDCARFAAIACPFMTLPKAQYRKAAMPTGYVDAAGFPSDRNPGATCLWTTREFNVFRVPSDTGNTGKLIRIGEPRSVEWFAEGRHATRAEVLHSIEGGLPDLAKLAAAQGPDAVEALKQHILAFQKYLPAAA